MLVRWVCTPMVFRASSMAVGTESVVALAGAQQQVLGCSLGAARTAGALAAPAAAAVP